MKRILMALATAIICTSCVTPSVTPAFTLGTEIDLDDVNRMIPSQTTIEKATQLLGSATLARFRADNSSVYQWRYFRTGVGGSSATFVVIIFDDQRIMTKVHYKGSRTSSTEIDLNDVNRMIPSQTTIEEATELLGPPIMATVNIDGSTVYQWQNLDTMVRDATVAGTGILFDDQGIMVKVQSQRNQKLSTN